VNTLKVKLDGVEYTVPPLKPYQLPFIKWYLSILNVEPKDKQEAEEMGKKLEVAVDEIVREVTPTPKDEHKLVLFNIIVAKYAERIDEALESFRGKERGILGRLPLP